MSATLTHHQDIHDPNDEIEIHGSREGIPATPSLQRTGKGLTVD
jgi:hypothetical protein